jgi:hypothetical protein
MESNKMDNDGWEKNENDEISLQSRGFNTTDR